MPSNPFCRGVLSLRTWSLVFVLVLIIGGEACAGHWSSAFSKCGVSFVVFALGEYDGNLIIGGELEEACGMPARAVVALDDAGTWRLLGSPPQLNPMSVITWHDRLWAAGWRSHQGGIVPALCSWDGSAWQNEGSWTGSMFNELSVFQDRLIAAGTVATVDSARAGLVASFDGITWTALGARPEGCSSLVRAVCDYDGTLYAGGHLCGHDPYPQHLARWNGAAWQAVSPEPDGQVNALCVYDGRLVVAGDFDQVGDLTVRGIAAWDGTQWLPMAAGLTWGPDQVVRCLTTFEDKLVAGGHFQADGPVSISDIAVWDGTSWAPLGSGTRTGSAALLVDNSEFRVGATAGMNSPTFPTDTMGSPPGVSALRVHSGRLYAGGSFNVLGGQVARNIACWIPDDASPFRLMQTCPNPTANGAGLLVSVSRPLDLVLTVFDVQGRRIAQPTFAGLREGQHPLVWDGRKANGRMASAGSYLLAVQGGGHREMGRVVVVR